MNGHAPVVGPVPGSRAALRAAHAASRLAAALRAHGPRAPCRRASHPRPRLRTGELDHPAPGRHGRSRPRALHAPSRPPPRAADASALPRCDRSTHPFRIARRRDLPQRALPDLRSTGGAAGDRARAAPRRATLLGLARALPSPRWALSAVLWRAMAGVYGSPTAQSLWSALEVAGLRVLRIEETLGGLGLLAVAEKP